MKKILSRKQIPFVEKVIDDSSLDAFKKEGVAEAPITEISGADEVMEHLNESARGKRTTFNGNDVLLYSGLRPDLVVELSSI